MKTRMSSTHCFGLGTRRPRALRAVLAVTVAAISTLSASAPASAAQRFASPRSEDVIGPCTVLAPCRLDHAVGGALPGDEVIVHPGTYQVDYPVVALVPVDVHGIVGQNRPHLTGTTSALTPVAKLTAGGSLSHLRIKGKVPALNAVELAGGIASDLEILSEGGGIELTGVTEGTVLRDSVVESVAGPAIRTKDDALPGTVKVLNVTASSTGPDEAIRGEQAGATTTVTNTIARGASFDVQAAAGAQLAIDHSNFRPATSSGYMDAGANQSGDPIFGSVTDNGLRPIATSPTIDGGTASDPALGTHDLDGRSRIIGSAPDIGAYEFSPDPDPVLPPPAPPVMGSTVGLVHKHGRVRVRQPGTADFVELASEASVPVGSTIDTRRGGVQLTSIRDAGGEQQTGTFWGGAFKVRQVASEDGYTDIVLTGGSFRSCRRAATASGIAHAAGLARFVRRLWARDRRGRFRTRGRNGHAVVRGTSWLTSDRCDGTLFKVRRGAIEVRAKGTRRRVVVRAGGRYLARSPHRRR